MNITPTSTPLRHSSIVLIIPCKAQDKHPRKYQASPKQQLGLHFSLAPDFLIMPSRIKLSRLFKSVSINDKHNDDIRVESRFLTILPPEIRILIYQELIHNYIISTDPRSGRIRIAEERSNETTQSSTVLTKSSAESLPLVCRQISREYNSVLATTLPKQLCFRESKRAAKDRAMSLSISNIKQNLREPTSNSRFDRVETLVIAHRSLVMLLRPIEERFFTSLRRIVLTGVPKDPAEIKARYQSLVFRGYEKVEDESTEDVWVFEYHVESNEYEFHRKMSFVRLGLASGQMTAAQAARAIRSISNARIAEAQPVGY